MLPNIDDAHFNMLEQQVRPSDVLNPRVLEALKNVARDQFVDDELSGIAYADTSLPIGYGQVMLPPVVQGRLLQAIDIQTEENVLEIGTGTGYLTAVLAQLANHITTVEIVAELSAMAKNNLEQATVTNVTCHIGDASHGWELANRIDVIFASASFEIVPDEYLQSLTVGGRMLVVVGKENSMAVQIIRRIAERAWQTDTVFETSIPAMINAEKQPEFKF
jgi:protein-L-isoaspartate(D-aspartate) O-methyltransferase